MNFLYKCFRQLFGGYILCDKIKRTTLELFDITLKLIQQYYQQNVCLSEYEFDRDKAKDELNQCHPYL